MESVQFPHGALSGNDILLDLLADNQRRLHRAIEHFCDNCLYWQPASGTNSIALTLWHMGRLFDVFLAQNIRGEAATAEVWQRAGWAAQTGYDPRGTGMEGWGTLNEYTPEEIAAVPTFTRQQLLDYIDQVYADARAYLQTTPMETLATAAPGLFGRFTKYQVLTMALMDNVRHLGEIMALHNLWEKRK